MSAVIEENLKSGKDSFEDVWDIIGPLQRDCEQAGKNLEENDTPFNRRTYVRTVFASIEAVVYVLKHTALQARNIGKFTEGEIAMLEEKTYTLDKGKPQAQTKFLSLDENFPFAIDMISRVFGSPFKLKKAKEWEALKRTIPVRNRITHPKKAEHLDISNEEIEAVGTASRLVVRSIIDSLVEGHNLLFTEVQEMCEKHGIACPNLEDIRR